MLITNRVSQNTYVVACSFLFKAFFWMISALSSLRTCAWIVEVSVDLQILHSAFLALRKGLPVALICAR